MPLNYINASFKNLSPSSINKSVKEVRKSPLYKSRTKIKQEYRDLYKEALEKFKHDKKLEAYDYRILMYNLDILNKDGYLDSFIQLFISDLDNLNQKEVFIRPILSYIYNNQPKDEVHNTYRLIKEISKEVKAKGEYKTIIRTIKRYDDLESFLKCIENKIIKAKSSEILEEIKTIYFIKDTDEFYANCMYSYALKNIYLEEHMDKNIEIINKMPYEKRIEIIKIALEKCKGRYKNLRTKWIIEMGNILNHPHEGSNSNWHEFNDEYKDEYINYYNNKILNIAFNEEQEDRKEFFINYTKHIYNIAYFENFRKSLVMEFKNHTLISMGNSLNIYNKNSYNIHKLKEILEVNKKSECNAMLKDEEVIEATLHYRKQWQHIFTEELLIRGYKGEG